MAKHMSVRKISPTWLVFQQQQGNTANKLINVKKQINSNTKYLLTLYT
jgi:hypothetical protein